MNIIKTLSELHKFNEDRIEQSKTLAFVPTMGALHEGHLSLVRQAQKNADQVIVSIFVNPTQFAPHEDFDAYPRTFDEDRAKLEEIGADAVWLPQVEDIYPNGQKSDIHINGVSEPLEGEHRPHFFDGVATVVKRLFDLVKPDIALFGEKDFQQLQVIKQLVFKFNLPINIIGSHIVRDENGLALSSRNAYLSKEEYKIAIQLNKILKEIISSSLTEDQAKEKLLTVGFDKIDYCTARNAETFLPENPNRILAAVWLGKTRLIDNMAIDNA